MQWDFNTVKVEGNGTHHGCVRAMCAVRLVLGPNVYQLFERKVVVRTSSKLVVVVKKKAVEI